MKKVALVVASLALAACSDIAPTAPNAISTPSYALVTSAGQNKLQCFDGTSDGGFGGTCTLPSKGAKGSAILSLTSTNVAGDYAGVYTDASLIYGQLLTNVTQLSYSYTGTKTPTPGNLSYNLPVDINGDGSTEFIAFIDAAYCGGVAGAVNITTDTSCGIYVNGSNSYPTWAAFVADYPGAKVATDGFVFIIAERTPAEPAATWTVSNVKFGKAGK